ncbi:pentapeptide repeat-containing protein [Natrinema sp. LN54]|uniref:pentapeptide repeat-containing protein n=1 Tax=Natrinema sp. LN54 TaxID=3458705 RepID=UPI0040354B1F
MESPPPDRCGYTWNGGHIYYTPQTYQSCCYRETLPDTDRCVWHADPDDTEKKTIEMLRETRESWIGSVSQSNFREILDGANVSDINFEEGFPFNRTALRQTDFQNANLTGANFREADLSGANLQGADLTGANFYRANLTGANLQGADLTKANIQDANLTGANLGQADLTSSNLITSELTSVHLQEANLTNANVQESDFSGSDLRDVNLSRSEVIRSKLQHTDLRGSVFQGTLLDHTDFSNADLRGAEFTDVKSVNSDFEGVIINGAEQFREAVNRTNELKKRVIIGGILGLITSVSIAALVASNAVSSPLTEEQIAIVISFIFLVFYGWLGGKIAELSTAIESIKEVIGNGSEG